MLANSKANAAIRVSWLVLLALFVLSTAKRTTAQSQTPPSMITALKAMLFMTTRARSQQTWPPKMMDSF